MYVKVNKPCGALYGKKIDIEESSLTQCECNPDEEDPCGPYSHCLNRMLLTECGPICRAGERCQNRAFEKRLYPKMVPYRTPHRGWGLKTLEPIKAGQFVIEYVGELIDEAEFRRRMQRKHETRDENFYFLTLDKERLIDAGPKGNLARFMNHCCEPNCETQKWTVLGDVRVGLFALRDIPANTEVTFNYNLECTGIEKKQCMCGAKRCAGYIGAKPKQEDPRPKKQHLPGKRTYKKRKNTTESPKADKPKRPVGRPAKPREPAEKPRELTEIEKDLLIIKNATNGISSDSESSGRLSSVDKDLVIKKEEKVVINETNAFKRKRVNSTEDKVLYNGCDSPSAKRVKVENEKKCEDMN
ncbi:SET domain-containing protein [Phthorimaea operculella]|nr:SET domain-containing protein [Phthorimaea operculella]